MKRSGLFVVLLAASAVQTCKSVQRPQPSSAFSSTHADGCTVCLRRDHGGCDAASSWMELPPQAPRQELCHQRVAEWSPQWGTPQQARERYEKKWVWPDPRLLAGQGVPFLIDGEVNALLLLQWNGDFVYWNTRTWSAKIILKSDKNGVRVPPGRESKNFVLLQKDGNLVLKNFDLGAVVLDSTDSFPHPDESIYGARVNPNAVHVEFLSSEAIALCAGVLVPSSFKTAEYWLWRRIWRSDRGPLAGEGQGYRDAMREKCLPD